jgi:outer membrane protein TolC
MVMLLVFPTMFFLHAEPLSLQQALTIASKNNPKIKQYEERLAQRGLDETNAKGSFLPTVTLTAGYSHMNAPLVMDLDPLREALLQLESVNQVQFASIASQMAGGSAISNPASPAYQSAYSSAYSSLNAALPKFVDTLKDQNYPSAAVTAVLPLFTGGSLVAAKRAANADHRASEYELAKIRNDVLQETVTNYLAVVLLNNVLHVRISVLAAMQQHCTNAEKLAAQGLIARYHVLRAKVAVSEAQRNLCDDSAKLEIALFALKKSLNYSDAAIIDVSDSLHFSAINEPADFFLNDASQNQPILHMVAEKKIMAKQKVAVQTGAMLPTIAAFGRYELFRDYLSALEAPWMIGINAQFTIFAGGKKYSARKSALHLVKEVDDIDSSAHRDISLWVNKAYRDMHSAQQRYFRLEADKELAAENMHLCKSRFESGYGTSLEVIDANLVTERNEIDRLTALYEYWKATADLLTATGRTATIIDMFIRKG